MEAAAVEETFPMSGGDGTYSYTKNSFYQRQATDFAMGTISEAIAERLDVKSLPSTSSTLRIADLGCSVGPNTFIAMQHVLEAIEKKCHAQGLTSKMPEFQVFFNDHASNDFNTLFTTLPPDRHYFAAGVPGSFHGRLFPESSLHFVYSSIALHWLSKVPEELLDSSSNAWNKGNIFYTNASEDVVNAYAAQFTKDMGIFLSARDKEIAAGGMMALILPCLPADPGHFKHEGGLHCDFLGSCLNDMVKSGSVSEAPVDSFNLPLYFPSTKHMTQLVEKNGCFSIEIMESLDPWLNMGTNFDGHTIIMHLRACLGGVFSRHFGSEIMHEMFERAFQRSAELSSLPHADYATKTQLFIVLKRK